MGYIRPGTTGILGEHNDREKIHPHPPKKRMRGLGDLVQRVFRAVGIEVAFKKVTKNRECGCKQRQEFLNRVVPFGKGEGDDMQSKQD